MEFVIPSEATQRATIDTLLWAATAGLTTLPRGFHRSPLADKYAHACEVLEGLRAKRETDQGITDFLRRYDRAYVAAASPLLADSTAGQGDSRPRVVFLLRGLGCGGAERVFISLAKHFIHAIPVAAVTSEPVADPAMLAELSRYCPVHVSRDTRLSTVAESLRVACSSQSPLPGGQLSADFILCFGSRNIAELRQAAGLQAAKFIDIGHSSYEWSELLPIYAECAEGADYLAAVSETCRLAFPADKQASVKVLYNGIEFDRITPRAGREATREKWGIAAGQKVLLFMGRFAAVKNPRAILTAMDHLPAEWRAVMVGPESSLKSEIESEACQGYSGRVVFPPAGQHVGDALAAADVFCLPSDSEGLPLAMLEAMGAGIPVVACRWAAMRELEGLHGELCETVNVRPTGRQLAEAVDMISTPGCGTRRLDHAKAVVWENYSAAAMAARWEAWLASRLR